MKEGRKQDFQRKSPIVSSSKNAIHKRKRSEKVDLLTLMPFIQSRFGIKHFHQHRPPVLVLLLL